MEGNDCTKKGKDPQQKECREKPVKNKGFFKKKSKQLLSKKLLNGSVFPNLCYICSSKH